MGNWFAVLQNRMDTDWGTGSFDFGEAVQMARKYGGEAIIAEIDGAYDEDGEPTTDPICVREYVTRERSNGRFLLCFRMSGDDLAHSMAKDFENEHDANVYVSIYTAELANLMGTPKQVKWADDIKRETMWHIREDFLPQMTDTFLGQLSELCGHSISTPEDVRYEIAMWYASKADAAWVIDNRSRCGVDDWLRTYIRDLKK